MQPVTRLLAVVVLYKLQPRDSSTLQTLLSVAASTYSEKLDLKILVWDNTPGGQLVEDLPEGVLYESAPQNPGLAQAYNQALRLADAEGYEWLLTLDQDSFVPENFLTRVADLGRELSQVETVGAIVPQVIADGRIISPFQFIFHAVPHWFHQGFVGISKRAAYAANSGSILRVSALREIDGYDPMFPLDLSDTNLFHRLYTSGKRVFIAGDVLMHHDFALLNKQARMSIERYDASLMDDCAFWDLYMGPLARFERILRFAVRICKDFFKPGETIFRERTLLELKRRLFKSRKARIAEWRAWATLRRDTSAQDQSVS
ncbi:glycosyltransferase [Granulicella arctica]|uniref:GT2 family glycosyltransferase n=1 Tax=Granulicella arctica TaxID=940613 RepID=A0A7Y9PE27_9BACT|nr:glycosyltransferase family 2 protein [Granulicella arctica]NYF78215.1 GT2 family glycosyltransferase [Granulicella arctica]